MKKAGIFLIIFVVIIAVAVGGIMIYAPARNWVGEKFSNLANVFKSEEKTNEERFELAKQDDRYKELNDDNKQKVEDKFDQITNSDEYKGMSDEEKDEIVDKLIESEKIQQDVQKEQEEQETRKEELKQELEDLSSNKQELEQRVQDLKDSGASEEEIKVAEEKQQKVEEQIKAAEQEQTYYELSDKVKDAVSQNEVFSVFNKGQSIKKIWGIYAIGGSVFVEVEMLRPQTICGVEINTKFNAICNIVADFRETSVEEILNAISNPDMVEIYTTCVNENLESQKEYFEQNKYSISKRIGEIEKFGYETRIIKSWEDDEGHPVFFVEEVSPDGSVFSTRFLTYDDDRYLSMSVKKICPEFWAQLEIEQAEARNENMMNRSEFATLDANGNTTSFDYSAYLSKQNSQQTSNQQTSQKSYLFSDELER